MEREKVICALNKDHTKRDMWDVTEDYYNAVEVGDYVRRDRSANDG